MSMVTILTPRTRGLVAGMTPHQAGLVTVQTQHQQKQRKVILF